jgi:hypothetical protein
VGGSSSASVTWITQNNVDIEAQYHYPVTSGTTYSCHVWFFDNDVAGRARPFIHWSNSSATYVNNYTTDQGTWQEKVTQGTALAADTWMTCGVRFYDVAPWDGDATILIDDMSITTP